MVNELKDKADIRGPVLKYNHYLQPEVFNENGGPLKLSEMLLFREFMRRPKRTNSLETQGLVQVGYLGLEKIHKIPLHRIPSFSEVTDAGGWIQNRQYGDY